MSCKYLLMRNSLLIPFSETGNAKITTPIDGFDDESLSTVFSPSNSTMPAPPLASTSSVSRDGMIIGILLASTVVALVCIAGIALLSRYRQRNNLHSLAKELGPKPWERREVDGNMVFPVNHELEGSKPVVHEVGGR